MSPVVNLDQEVHDQAANVNEPPELEDSDTDDPPEVADSVIWYEIPQDDEDRLGSDLIAVYRHYRKWTTR